MEPHDVVFVEGLSWTKADKKAQMSKVRTHARIIGLKTLELRRRSGPVVKVVPNRRRQATTGTPGQEHSLRPLAPALETAPDGSRASAATSSPTRKPSLETEKPPCELDVNSSELQHSARPVIVRIDPDPHLRGYRQVPFKLIPPHACQDALDFYTRYYVPNNAAMYEIFNVTNIFNTFFLELLQHPVFFHAGLANVLHELEFCQNPGAKPSQRVYMQVGMALAMLRREIVVRESLLDDIFIAAVMNLAVVARQLGDQKAHKLHREQLRAMVRARGGLDALDRDGLQKCMILQWEGFWCWAGGQGPSIFAKERSNPNATKYPGNAHKLLSQLPVGFQDLAKAGVLTLPTIEVLVRTARKVTDKKNNTPVRRDGDVFTCKKRRYHDLMQACPALANETPTLEKLIVMAVIIYCSAAFCEVRLPTRHTAVTAVGATRELSRLTTPTTRADLKALKWVYMVVLDAWRSRERHMRSPGVNLLKIFKRRFPEMEDWGDVTEELKDFFWNQDMESFMKEAWEAV